MLSKEAFVDFILKGAAAKTVVASAGSLGSALPEGFEEFDVGGCRANALRRRDIRPTPARSRRLRFA